MKYLRVRAFAGTIPGIATAIALAVAGISDRSDAAPTVPRWSYVSPLPSSADHPPTTTIAIRSSESLNPSTLRGRVAVTGSASGRHGCSIELAFDRETIVVVPTTAFAWDETVAVDLGRGVKSSAGTALPPLSFTFRTAREWMADQRAAVMRAIRSDEPADLPTSAAAPMPLPPAYPRAITTVLNNPAPGRLVLANQQLAGDPALPYLMVNDNAGAPIDSLRLPVPTLFFNLFPGGRFVNADLQTGSFALRDSTLKVVDRFACGNGYTTDPHAAALLPRGTALLIGTGSRIVDMRPFVQDGDSAAIVYEPIVQEIDASHRVVFQWRALDYLRADAAPHVNLTDHVIDFAHANSIDSTTDGNIILSCRHLDAVLKIDRKTGKILWQLGGKNSTFRFVGDTIGFSAQHDAHMLPNGNITLFDNGNYHTPNFSRACEYQLDPTAATARLVWQYRHVPETFGMIHGSVQRLPNGNTLICWGASPFTATEVTPDGTVTFEMIFAGHNSPYEVHRHPWKGASMALLPPVLWLPADSSNAADTLPLLSWYRAWGGDGYNVQVASDSSFAPPIRSATVTAESVSVSPALALGRMYYWRVRATKGATTTDWSAVRRFSIPSSPPQVTLVSPKGVDTAGVDHVRFNWFASDGANRYTIETATSSDFRYGRSIDSSIVDTTIVALLPCDGCGLWWRVRAHGAVGWGAYAEARRVDVRLSLPKLIAPSPGDSIDADSVRLVWRRSDSTITRFSFQLATDSLFQSLRASEPATEDTQFVFSPLVPGTRYWWRVQEGTEIGWGKLGDGQWFARPRGTSPGVGETAPATLLLPRVTASPNPSSGSATIRFGLHDRSAVTVAVVDELGRTVWSHTSSMIGGEHELPIDSSGLPAGTYRCIVRAGSQSASCPLVLAR